MANVIGGHVWVLDTVATIWTGLVNVAEISYKGHAGLGSSCTLTDTFGTVVFKGNPTAVSEEPQTSLGEGFTIDGLKVTVLTDGKVYVAVL